MSGGGGHAASGGGWGGGGEPVAEGGEGAGGGGAAEGVGGLDGGGGAGGAADGEGGFGSDSSHRGTEPQREENEEVAAADLFAGKRTGGEEEVKRAGLWKPRGGGGFLHSGTPVLWINRTTSRWRLRGGEAEEGISPEKKPP